MTSDALAVLPDAGLPVEEAAVDHALIVVDSATFELKLDLASLWRYRELLYFFWLREIKVRYKQTTIGAAWAVLQPVLTMLAFAVVLGNFIKYREGTPYPIFVYTGLLPWTFFSYVMTQGSGSIVGATDMLSKVYFPRLLLPLASILCGLMDFGISLFVLVGMMIFYGITPTLAVLTVPAFMILAIAASLGVGIWLAALNVKYRDVRYAVPFLTQIWLYVTPVIFPPNLVKGPMHWILALNPISGVVIGFRWALLPKLGLDWASFAISCAMIVLLLASGLWYFGKTEQFFADVA